MGRISSARTVERTSLATSEHCAACGLSVNEQSAPCLPLLKQQLRLTLFSMALTSLAHCLAPALRSSIWITSAIPWVLLRSACATVESTRGVCTKLYLLVAPHVFPK